MVIKNIIFKNPFSNKYTNPLKLNNLNKLNVIIGKNNSGKTTILDHLITYLGRRNQSNSALSKLSVKISIKELIMILNKKLEAPPQFSDPMKVHSTLDEDKLKLYKDFKLFMEKINDPLELSNSVEIIFNRDLKERKIKRIEYRVDDLLQSTKLNMFLEKLEILHKYSILNSWILFDYFIDSYQKLFICATRLLESGEQYSDKPIPNINKTLMKLHEGRISSNSIIDQEDQYRFEIFRIPNLSLMLEYIKRGEIAKIFREKYNEVYIDKFKKNLKKFFPKYDLSTYFKLNPPESGQEIIEDDFSIGGWKALGHGHQELISLLFLFSLPDNYIYLVDEPDIGLHPELQIKLLHFVNEIAIDKEYNKQFFFATHSPCFIDFKLNCSHYLCQKDSDKFEIKMIEKEDLSLIRNELGFSPGSLFQSTGIIWVEGPSEYTYVRLLFECFNFDVDYYGILIVPYFGCENITTKHLSFERLKDINQNFIIIMDSDKKKTKLYNKKLKIKKEFEKNGIFFWLIESFCDIEGFLPQSFLNDHFQIQIQKDDSHIKDPCVKLDDYVKNKKKEGIIPKSAPKYKKTRDASKFREKILENSTFKNEMAQNQGLKENIEKMIKIIKKWANI